MGAIALVWPRLKKKKSGGENKGDVLIVDT